MGRATNGRAGAGIEGRFATALGKHSRRTDTDADVQVAREDERKAAREYGPLWMQLDDDRSGAIEAAASEYAQALAAAELSEDQRRLRTSVSGFAVREALRSIHAPLRRACATLQVTSGEGFDVSPAELAGRVPDSHSSQGSARPDLIVSEVRYQTKVIVREHAALKLYELGVAPDPAAAARRLGVSEGQVIAAGRLDAEQWQKALRRWLSTGAEPEYASKYVTLQLKAPSRSHD